MNVSFLLSAQCQSLYVQCLLIKCGIDTCDCKMCAYRTCIVLRLYRLSRSIRIRLHQHDIFMNDSTPTPYVRGNVIFYELNARVHYKVLPLAVFQLNCERNAFHFLNDQQNSNKRMSLKCKFSNLPKVSLVSLKKIIFQNSHVFHVYKNKIMVFKILSQFYHKIFVLKSNFLF